jgi:hypothetical protein
MPEILEYDKIFYTNFEPKMQMRFIMEMEGVPSFLVKAANRPTVNQEAIELDHINLKRKFKGKTTWDDMTLTFYDPIVPSGAQIVMDWIRLSHESITGRDGYAAFYKKDIGFYMLGPVGDKIEQWTIKGAFISSANFGEMDWSSSDMVNIEVTLSYDYAILEY